MADTKDLHKLNESELFWYVRNNVNVVNQKLTQLENSDIGHSSNAYRYVQNKLRNRSFMTVNKNGDVRFIGKSKDIRNLNRNDLFAMAQYIQNYKNTKTGTVEKYEALQEEIRSSLNNYIKEQGFETQLSKNDMETLFKDSDWDKNLRSSDRLFKIVEKYGVDVARYWIDELGKGMSLLEEEDELRKKYNELHKIDRGKEETSDFSGKLFT